MGNPIAIESPPHQFFKCLRLCNLYIGSSVSIYMHIFRLKNKISNTNWIYISVQNRLPNYRFIIVQTMINHKTHTIQSHNNNFRITIVGIWIQPYKKKNVFTHTRSDTIADNVLKKLKPITNNKRCYFDIWTDL